MTTPADQPELPLAGPSPRPNFVPVHFPGADAQPWIDRGAIVRGFISNSPDRDHRDPTRNDYAAPWLPWLLHLDWPSPLNQSTPPPTPAEPEHPHWTSWKDRIENCSTTHKTDEDMLPLPLKPSSLTPPTLLQTLPR